MLMDNTFYRSEMDGGSWHVYLFNASWNGQTYGMWGKNDLPGTINSYHHKDIFDRAEKIDGREEFLSPLKHFILKAVFNLEGF